jgi:hypothetical protein
VGATCQRQWVITLHQKFGSFNFIDGIKESERQWLIKELECVHIEKRSLSTWRSGIRLRNRWPGFLNPPSWMFLNVLECSWMFLNVLECSWMCKVFLKKTIAMLLCMIDLTCIACVLKQKYKSVGPKLFSKTLWKKSS